MMNRKKIVKCKFCGRKASVYLMSHVYEKTGRKLYGVQCSCGAIVSFMGNDLTPDQVKAAYNSNDPSKLWLANRRMS